MRRLPRHARTLCAALVWFLAQGGAQAASAASEGVERGGDVLQIVLPVTAFAMTFGLKDYEGTRQLTKSFLATMTATLALKVAIDAERPDGGGQSFPSGHTAAAFAGASFMQRRYGLRVGIPAYGAAAFVAWSRVDADRHHVRDVVAAAGLAVLSSYTLARPLPNNITVLPTADDGVFGLMFSRSW